MQNKERGFSRNSIAGIGLRTSEKLPAVSIAASLFTILAISQMVKSLLLVVVNSFFNHFIWLSFADCVRFIPAAILGLDVMESYKVAIKRPEGFSFPRRPQIFKGVLIRLRCFSRKLFIRPTRVLNPSRRSFQGKLGR